MAIWYPIDFAAQIPIEFAAHRWKSKEPPQTFVPKINIQKINNLQFEKCRYKNNIKNVVGHCTVFSLNTAKIIIWTNIFSEIWPGLM